MDALCIFKEHGLDGNEVSQGTFPLPSLSLRLDNVCTDVYEGRGFAIVRGLNPDEYSVEDLTIVYLGLSSYVGERRGKQDQRGSMLMHVIKRNDEDRDVQYSEDKPFHTDTVTDCLCLFTQSLADVGGHSVIASSWTVYNELAATRPDLIEVLSAPDWPFDTFGRDPKFYCRPLLFYHHGRLIISFSRRLLVGHEPFDTRTPGIPGLTEAQAEALDAVHIIARKHEFKPRMERGDLRFINNMSILHRREAFENTTTAARHLVRIWLNNEMMCWKLPRPLRVAWARVFDDDERDEHWDIVPPRKDGKVLRVAGTCD
ncbi:Taurine hydroxylase-like protein SAT17 like [Verticillium longisporum]|nr:Taurine hydroxylase-like protein SAT17 like [Verticillium longisporum]